MIDRSDSHEQALAAFAAASRGTDSGYPEKVRIVAMADVDQDPMRLDELLDNTLLKGMALALVREDGSQMIFEIERSGSLFDRVLRRVRGRVTVAIQMQQLDGSIVSAPHNELRRGHAHELLCLT